MGPNPNQILLACAVIAILCLLVLAFLTGRRRRWRDPQRFFSYADKAAMRQRAGHRCEHKAPLWSRCSTPSQEADHVVPWSKGGPTHVDNGQMLCLRHNQRKSARMPSPIYRWRLQRRRRRYVRA